MLYELKNLRKASGFTQASMAEKLGVPLGTYRNWEQGIYAPVPRTRGDDPYSKYLGQESIRCSPHTRG